LTSREAPGGDPPSAAAPAQAAGPARVQELRAAREQALTQAQELSTKLTQERAQAEKVARSYNRARKRAAAKVKELAVHNQRVTPSQWDELSREVGRELDLASELRQIQAQVQALAEGLTRAHSRAQGLERALALAMAQARTLAWQKAQARSPRLRAMAVARFIWRLLQARPGLWDGIVRNLYLGMRVVGLAVWMLPTADRDRWKNESYNELEELKQEGAPLLGDALRIAVRTPWLALELWTGAWGRSPVGRWLPRLRPLWIGLGTAAATFLGGAAGIGQSPTEFQMRSLVGASMLTGALAAYQGYKRRRPRRRKRR
jgi:hypothetical protein